MSHRVCRSLSRPAQARGKLAAVAGFLALASSPAMALTTLVQENFDTDPVTGLRATVQGDGTRLTQNTGFLTAAYDSSKATTTLRFSLGRSLNQNDDFAFSTVFRIRSEGFYAHPAANSQIAFGLINNTTTGTDRAGGTFGSEPAAFDIVTFDYYPNVTEYNGQTLSPTVIESDTSSGNFFAKIDAPFSSESGLYDAGESPLPQDTWLTANISYQAAGKKLTLTVGTSAGLLDINKIGDGGAVGGNDSNSTTIVNNLLLTSELFLSDPFQAFSVDTFALTLWNDSFGVFGPPFDQPGLTALVDFDSFEVLGPGEDPGTNPQPVPEPATAGMAMLTLAALAMRRQRV